MSCSFSGLAIDRTTGKLFWTDTGPSSIGRIFTSDLDGGSIEEFLSRPKDTMLTAITVVDDKVYWAENTSSIVYVQKQNPNNVKFLRKDTPKVMEMFVYDSNAQQGN